MGKHDHILSEGPMKPPLHTHTPHFMYLRETPVSGVEKEKKENMPI